MNHTTESELAALNGRRRRSIAGAAPQIHRGHLQLMGQRLNAAVQLIKALGGGMESM